MKHSRAIVQREGFSRAAVGFRVKSGYALAVVLGGTVAAPELVACRVVELSDPAVPETKQPYHDGFYKTEENTREIERRIGIVRRCAKKSIDALVKDISSAKALRLARPEPVEGRARSGHASAERLRAGLVVGSVIDPATVGNPHIRAHASEGRLFRTVLEEALRALEIDCEVFVEKQLAIDAQRRLARTGAAISRTVAALGKAADGPWRAEEKAAATAAWLALA